MRLTVEQALKLLAPLQGDNPCGKSVRDDVDYESIVAEIRRTQSLSGGAISWPNVATHAYAILSETSKDISVAAYFACAEFELDGYRGLQYGLGVLDSLLDQYWEQCYPDLTRIRGRLGALEWMAKHLEKAVPAKAPKETEGESVISASTLMDAFMDKLRNRFQGKEPDFGASANACRRYAADFKRAIAEQKSATTESVAKAAVPSSGTTTASAPMVVASESDVAPTLVRAQESLLDVVNYLLEHDLKDERLYRCHRLALWLNIDALPPHEDGVTQIGSAVVAEADAFEIQLTGGHYEALARSAEECVGRAPFWLDSHRYVATALSALGPQYAVAHRAVLSGLAGFLLRFPDVVKLKFFDGIPFANAATQMWIEAEVLPTSATGNAAEAGAGGARPAWEVALRDARVLSSKRDDAGAFVLFANGVAQAGLGRDRFMWALQRASFSLSAGHLDAALAQYEHLDRDCLARQLAQWEPDAAAQVYGGLLMCVDQILEKRENAVAGMVPRVRDAFARLCELDLAKAIEISQRVGIKKVLNEMYEPERR